MRRTDIDKKFTDKVYEYLMQGYTFCTKSMRGSQGEQGKVDLVKGDELIRIYLDTRTGYDDGEHWTDTMVLRVGKWQHSPKDVADHDRTVWMWELDIISETIFYKVHYAADWYIMDKDEFIRNRDIHKQRIYSRDYSPEKKVWYRNDVARNAAYNYLRRKVGYKRLKWDDIEVLKIVTTSEAPVFYVVYRDTRYKLV